MQNHDFKLGTIGQISRVVKDIKAATNWYQEKLGLRLLFQFDMMAFFDCDGVRLTLNQSDDLVNSILYFQVPDIVQAETEMTRRGVDFIRAAHKIHEHEDGTEEWMAFFKDIDGEPLALLSQVASA